MPTNELINSLCEVQTDGRCFSVKCLMAVPQPCAFISFLGGVGKKAAVLPAGLEGFRTLALVFPLHPSVWAAFARLSLKGEALALSPQRIRLERLCGGPGGWMTPAALGDLLFALT